MIRKCGGPKLREELEPTSKLSKLLHRLTEVVRSGVVSALTSSDEAKSIASSTKEARELTKQEETIRKLRLFLSDAKSLAKGGSEAAAKESFRYVVSRINGILSLIESLLVSLDLPVSLEVGAFTRKVQRVLWDKAEDEPGLNYMRIAYSFERMRRALSKGERYVGEYEKGFIGFHRFGEVISEVLEAIGEVLSEMLEGGLAREALKVAGQVDHEFRKASSEAEESRDSQRRMCSEAENPVDYDRIAREFDHIREVGMEGVRSAREGSFLRVGNGAAAVLDSLGNILAALGEDHLGDRAATLADEVREATRPEVRPDESKAPRGRRLFEQQEGGLTSFEIRRIAEHIVEGDLMGDFERRMKAFDKASEDLYDWIQGLPAFPPAKSDRWNLRQVFEIEDELLRQFRGVGVVREGR